jgi:hypothetical protein
MRSIALVSTAIVALVGMAPMASAATKHSIHRAQPRQMVYGEPLSAPTAGYPRSELWPHCYGGVACTAAGYPNLHYFREIEGLLY